MFRIPNNARPDRHIGRVPAAVPMALTLLIAVVVAVLASACGEAAPEGLAGMVRTPEPYVGDVTLPEASNGDAAFSTKADDGQLLVVYFGYTSCPDVCPTTLADLRSAVATLNGDSDRIDVAFITVDPGRDTEDEVTSYVRVFFPDGIALRTEDDVALQEAADAYGAAYEVASGPDGAIEVAHSAFLYAIDSDGMIKVQWPFGMTSEHIANDLAYLLNDMS